MLRREHADSISLRGDASPNWRIIPVVDAAQPSQGGRRTLAGLHNHAGWMVPHGAAAYPACAPSGGDNVATKGKQDG
jgi:hypothetical protein